MLVLQTCTELEEYHEGNQDQTHICYYRSISKFLHKFSLPISPKSETLMMVFWVGRFSTFGSKHIFLRTNKADQKHCENWQCESGSEFHKTFPMCERGEWRKQLRDFIIQSLKQPPLGSVLFRAFLVTGKWWNHKKRKDAMKEIITFRTSIIMLRESQFLMRENWILPSCKLQAGPIKFPLDTCTHNVSKLSELTSGRWWLYFWSIYSRPAEG